jgi:hypothetical protein
VLVDEDPVRLDGFLVEVPSSSLKPVADGFAYRVAVAGLDASFQVIDGPDEPVFDLLLGPALFLIRMRLPRPSYPRSITPVYPPRSG